MKGKPQIKAVYLFGSRAGGCFSAYSDADLLIVLREDSGRMFDRISDHLESFLNAPVPVDVFPYTEDELKASRFAADASMHGILLTARAQSDI